MIKILFMGGLIYLLYRMVMGPYLNAPKMEETQNEDREGEYVDYEEVD